MESDHSTHQFSQDASFERAVDLYIFDREFRLLLLDAIERVEVAVRTQYAYPELTFEPIEEWFW